MLLWFLLQRDFNLENVLNAASVYVRRKVHFKINLRAAFHALTVRCNQMRAVDVFNCDVGICLALYPASLVTFNSFKF